MNVKFEAMAIPTGSERNHTDAWTVGNLTTQVEEERMSQFNGQAPEFGTFYISCRFENWL